MRRHLHFSLALAILTFFTAASHLLAADSATPKEVSKLFYDKLRLLKVRGLPVGDDWAQIKPLVTDKMTAAIESAQKEQADFIKKHPGEKPPWIEGDLFSSLFEGSTSHEVVTEKIHGNEAEVSVLFTYEYNGQKTTWNDTLILQKTNNSWLVADLKYAGDWDFASKGTLLQSLAPEQE